ncbi:hypothetical protein V7200_07845 [Cytobacillus firmus]|nr:hypothetical protein [Cytobacillus firmus]
MKIEQAGMKSARRPPIGDKHKTSRLKGCSLTFRRIERNVEATAQGRLA